MAMATGVTRVGGCYSCVSRVAMGWGAGEEFCATTEANVDVVVSISRKNTTRSKGIRQGGGGGGDATRITRL